MCSPAHPLNSAPSTMSEVTGPRSVLCLAGGPEDAQHWAGPGCPSAKLEGTAAWSAVGLHAPGGLGRDVRMLRPWG